ncbi:hypothetical protein [Hydrocarboniphaga effusa]
MEAQLIILGGVAFYSAMLAISGFAIGVCWAAKKIKSGQLKVSV